MSIYRGAPHLFKLEDPPSQQFIDLYGLRNERRFQFDRIKFQIVKKLNLGEHAFKRNLKVDALLAKIEEIKTKLSLQ